MRLLLSLLLFGCLASTSYAKLYYRHPPFDLSIERQDSVAVDYQNQDAEELRCAANSNTLKVSFSYKGRHKIARLPVIVEHDHVPLKVDEELADSQGLLSVQTDPSDLTKTYRIHCEYYLKSAK